MNDNITKIQELYAAFGRGDVPTLLANVTDDVDWGSDSPAGAKSVPWYGVRKGREGVGEFFTVLGGNVEFPKFEPSQFAAVDDQVYVHIDYEYRFPKNGKGFKSSSVHQFTLRDGKVSKFRAYEDTAGALEAWTS
jgi:ketosteroid isomerase-like protein